MSLARQGSCRVRSAHAFAICARIVVFVGVVCGGVAHAQVSSVTVAANRTSPQPVGTAITWTATATGGNHPLWYWWSVAQGGNWVGGSSAWVSNTFTWTPQQTGTFQVCVGVVSDDGDFTSEGEAVGCATNMVIVSSPTVTGVTVSANRSSPQMIGTAITFTATPTAGTGTPPLSYKWSVSSDNGTTWSTLQDWTQNASQYLWTPQSVNSSWKIKAAVRSSGSTNANGEASNTIDFATIGSPTVTSVAITASPSLPSVVGTTINWTATPAGGTPPLSYWWTLEREGGYIGGSNGFVGNQFVWTPQQTGNYRIGVSVWNANADLDGDPDASTTLNFAITDPPPSDAFIYDSFVALNGTAIAGRKPEVSPAGTSWLVMGSPTPSLQTNQATITSGTGWVLATVETGLSNALIGATVLPGSANPWAGVAVRLTDANNFIMVGYRSDLFLARVQNGVTTVLQSAQVAAPVAWVPHRIDVRLIADHLQVYWDGFFAFEYITSFQQQATRHGLAWYPPLDAASRLDAFEVSGSPIISGPANQTNVVGTTIAPVQITALDLAGLPVTYAASGLPSGLSVNASTGSITGTIGVTAGAYTVTVTATDGTFTGSRTFTWTVLATPPSPPTAASVFDTFTTNGTSRPLSGRVPGTTWNGAAWSIVDGSSPTVDVGEAAGGLGSSSYGLATIESGTKDGIMAVDFRSTSTNRSAGLALRVADPNNYLLLRYVGNWNSGRIELVRRVNGIFSLIAGVPVGPLDGAHRLEARLNGISITALLDGMSLFERTSNDNQYGTRHGLIWSSSETTAYDNFTVTTQILPATLPSGTTCEATLSRWVVPVANGGGSPTVDVTMPAPCMWSAWIFSGSFATVGGPFPRYGNSPAQFTLGAHGGLYPRQAYAVVAGKLVTIEQAGTSVGQCGYSVTPSSGLFYTGDGGSQTVTVTPTYSACSWTVTPDYRSPDPGGWIGISDNSLHTTAGTVTISLGRNVLPTNRHAYLTIGTRTEYVVDQLPEQCSFSFNNSSTVTTDTRRMSSDSTSVDQWVYASNSTCGWEAVPTANWITISENPTGSGSLNFRISVPNNPTGSPVRQGYVEVRHGGIVWLVVTVLQCQVGAGTTCDPPGTDPGGEVSYFHTDAIGSVRMITDASGNATRYDYLPFGEPWGSQAASTLKFTGKERDVETTFGGQQPLDYFGARYYQSQSGRFTTVDPGLDVEKVLYNPQLWNRYTYALNNPLTFTDPDGRNPLFVGGGIGATVFGAWKAYLNVQQGRPWYENVGVEAGKGFIIGATLGLAAPAVAAATTSVLTGCYVSPACQASALGALEGLANGGPTGTASAFGFTRVEGVIEGFTYGRLGNGAEVAARFSRTGDTLTTSVLGAFNAEGAKASGTLSAILQGSQAVAKQQGAKQLVIQAVGVVNKRLADVLVKQGFRQTTIRVGKETITAYEKLYEVDW